MTARLALRALLARPVRSAVLVAGFGFGVAVMAMLLGVGEVVLEQSRAPALRGGGDLVLYGMAGPIPNARLVMKTLREEGNARGVRAVSPWSREYLELEHAGVTTRVEVRGGIPSLQRALGDPEISQVSNWTDDEGDVRWTVPTTDDLLRSIDRFHAIPPAGAGVEGWAEWLYFNGRSADDRVRFYVTFLAGPRTDDGRRSAGVRAQVEIDDERFDAWVADTIDEETLLASAPDLTIGASLVRLTEAGYRIHLDVPVANRMGRPGERTARPVAVQADLLLLADLRGVIAPIVIHGAHGWISGYVVPVPSGSLTGELRAGSRAVTIADGVGYHDHNWGFWSGVTWQWGQVAGDGLSIIYGRVRPPDSVADPDRIPGFLVLLGSESNPMAKQGTSAAASRPLAMTSDVTITETDAPDALLVRARGATFDLTIEAVVESLFATSMGGPFATTNSPGTTSPIRLLQMRTRARVTGRLGDRSIAFEAPGSAETFRGAALGQGTM